MLFTTNLQHGAKHCYTIIDTINKDLQLQKVQFILKSFFSPMPHAFFELNVVILTFNHNNSFFLHYFNHQWITSVWAGPEAKKMKKGDFKTSVKAMTKEELKINRQQRKKELKKNRQQTERKDMFDIICQAKQVWGSLRRYTHSSNHQKRANLTPSCCWIKHTSRGIYSLMFFII